MRKEQKRSSMKMDLQKNNIMGKEQKRFSIKMDLQKNDTEKKKKDFS